MTDLVTFCRHHQFRPALCLFVHLLGQVNYHPPSSSEYQSFLAALDNDQRKATLVQKSVSTMVRYAPNARTSFAFALFALKDLGCVRDENLDNTLLINLIYVCKLEHTPLAMDQALKLVKDGVKRGLTKPRVVDAKDKLNEKYREPHTAFISVSRSVASYFHMEIDCQNHALVSQRPR
ncbi:hypothetical protein DM01DRAFT_1332160 [Hesseltinella vesiculosa]|uniref:Uncharacterized protein n=1 Tax=Hesseltinella vesiculosa TaxID=101127 RepID=A0A1X2GVG8_9FUNG|nr:hypothetical protein DM01DRAFT_1332160 [Hesseltinella vesiculosa]